MIYFDDEPVEMTPELWRKLMRMTLPQQFPLIPGMKVQDVTGLLERFLYTCTKPHEFKKRWTTACKNIDDTKFVTINGPNNHQVDFMSWSIVQKEQPNDAYASEFLALASMLFLPPLSYQVQDWIGKSVPLVGDGSNRQVATFGHVKCTLYGEPAVRSLDIEGVE